MDILRRVALTLYPKLPTCYLCHLSLYEAQSYACFTCLHFLCFRCAAAATTVVCAVCARSEFIDCDYASLEATRMRFADTINGLMAGDAMQFPAVFDCFYHLLAYFDPRILVQAPAEGQWEKCACGRRKRVGSDCSCGYITRRRTKLCSLCHLPMCDCMTVRSGKQLWTCGACGYEYNWRVTQKCERCGNLTASSNVQVTPG